MLNECISAYCHNSKKILLTFNTDSVNFCGTKHAKKKKKVSHHPSKLLVIYKQIGQVTKSFQSFDKWPIYKISKRTALQILCNYVTV